MTGRERVAAAVHYRRPDRIPVEYLYSDVGYYEHGEKLNDLYAGLPGDFEPFRRMPIPGPGPGEVNERGEFHAFRRDEWGTVWEYRIFGIAGIPYRYPLAEEADIPGYILPPGADLSPEGLRKGREEAGGHQREHYLSVGAGNLFERLIALRPQADVLCDIELEEPGITLLADRIAARARTFVERAAAIGADGVRFGDDYGTERALLMSPRTWRRFFKPRLREIFAPARRAGLDIHFHSCGQVGDILEDLAELGVNSIWPQLPAYDMGELARRCRELKLAVAVHTDRANTMTYGTPEDVRALVLRECEVFRMHEGGAWFYIEADNGFPFENLQALVETVREIR